MDEAAPSAPAAWLPMGAADEVLGLSLRMWGPRVAPNGDEGDAPMGLAWCIPKLAWVYQCLCKL